MIKVFIVEKGDLRIDKYLVSVLTDKTRSELRHYFNEGKISVNGQIVKASYLLKTGDAIQFEDQITINHDIIPQNIPLDIIYEDDAIIIVNKPQGMVVHPAFGHNHNTLVNALMYHSQALSDLSGSARLGIVHRIDKDTSGLLVACKTNQAHRFISEQFREKTTIRKYYAICCGVINHNLGKIDAPIARDPNLRQKMAVVENGKPSITHFRVLERFKQHTLLELSLETGRTHQIRVHLAYIGYPILGDPLYGPKKVIGTEGQYLHAKTLGFVHPTTKAFVEFDSLLPAYFTDRLALLKKE